MLTPPAAVTTADGHHRLTATMATVSEVTTVSPMIVASIVVKVMVVVKLSIVEPGTDSDPKVKKRVVVWPTIVRPIVGPVIRRRMIRGYNVTRRRRKSRAEPFGAPPRHTVDGPDGWR